MTTKRGTKTPARRPPVRRRSWQPMVAAGAVAVALAAVLAVVWATSRSTPGTDAGSSGGARLEHIHGLGVDPADSALYAATHHGVFRLAADDTATRVGEGEQDTMGFTIAGPRRFLASGHPAPDQDGPDHLGLIESTDAGVTWTTLSLPGEADFHALRFRHGVVYGFNSVTGQLMASRDKTTWESRSSLPMRDLAVSPTDPQLLLATTQSGPVRSADGGRTWSAAGGPVLALLDWQSPDLLWGVATTGDVLRSADGGVSWTTAGRAGGIPAAFTAGEDGLYLATADARILHSGDAGVTWTTRYPATGSP